MPSLDAIIASVADTRLSLEVLLRRLHVQGRLAPLVREALAGQFIQEKARQAGLSATPEELQAAADSFRRRHGLNAAADTHAWLTGREMSVDDFQTALEDNLLAAKLRTRLAAGEVDGYFAAHKAGWERLRLVQLVVWREDLARELASQIRDEGRDLADVAREQGLQPVRGELLRRELIGPLAEALASPRVGELVGPVGTPQGFALVVVEERWPAELDAAARQHIENELFQNWLHARMREATYDRTLLGPS